VEIAGQTGMVRAADPRSIVFPSLPQFGVFRIVLCGAKRRILEAMQAHRRKPAGRGPANVLCPELAV